MTVETALTADRETADRIKAHLPCLERTAKAPGVADEVRRALWAEIAMFRVGLALLGADLPRNDPERNGTHHG